jgi:hypothetical protein
LNWQSHLHDGGPPIELAGDVVNGGTRLSIPGVDGALMGMQSRVFGEQRRMDIEKPAGKTIDKNGREDSHKPGENDQIRLVSGDCIA